MTLELGSAFAESVSENLKYFEETVNRSSLTFDMAAGNGLQENEVMLLETGGKGILIM